MVDTTAWKLVQLPKCQKQKLWKLKQMWVGIWDQNYPNCRCLTASIPKLSLEERWATRGSTLVTIKVFLIIHIMIVSSHEMYFEDHVSSQTSLKVFNFWACPSPSPTLVCFRFKNQPAVESSEKSQWTPSRSMPCLIRKTSKVANCRADVQNGEHTKSCH